MNPKLKHFIEEYSEMTLIGFAWACYWRMMLVIFGVYMGFALIAIIFVGLANI